MHAHSYALAHAHVGRQANRQTDTHTHKRMRMRTHTHTPAHTRTHTHTHAHTPVSSDPFPRISMMEVSSSKQNRAHRRSVMATGEGFGFESNKGMHGIVNV